ncbi:MAG: serine hydrolase [Planctomycetaceae bacterium]
MVSSSSGIRWWLFSLVLGFTLVGIRTPVMSEEHSSRESAFPRKEWQSRSPEEVGLDAGKLEEFREFVGGRGCVVRHGYLVDSWGDYDRPHDIASAIKPFYSYLMLQAVASGKLHDFDEPVSNYWNELPAFKDSPDHPDLQLTFRHLGFQVGCLGYTESPGTAFDYNDGTMGFFWDTLINKVYGIPWEEAEKQVIGPLLSEPLQFQDGTRNILQHHTGRFQVSARDFCRFGLLFMHQGRWNGKQVLREDLARMAISDPLPLSIARTHGEKSDTVFPLRTIGGRGNQCDHNGGYSWMWWLNRTARDGNLWFADVPTDFYACFGHGGREGMAVFPTQEIIVSWITDRELHQNREDGNRAFELLVKSTVADSPSEFQ